jgi:hypothetical protein
MRAHQHLEARCAHSSACDADVIGRPQSIFGAGGARSAASFGLRAE